MLLQVKPAKVFKTYWSKHSDAFNKTWRHDVLWINPPHNLLEKIVTKIMIHQAQGIIIIPVVFH